MKKLISNNRIYDYFMLNESSFFSSNVEQNYLEDEDVSKFVLLKNTYINRREMQIESINLVQESRLSISDVRKREIEGIDSFRRDLEKFSL